ncbi:CCN family member 5-like [Paramacrobiotus metropolitanus]|uniref:CCN family member 5-like n=1 Tax=Paramacrobiotus metropolitanus TaxID=2943436 RepID=UPI0024463D6B|nr:CCN family member 5-like [Paramacrobiotus metropolitanus]XP_055334851.1 CCN family member 5-like [Paramacrobiotus metropolitanus]
MENTPCSNRLNLHWISLTILYCYAFVQSAIVFCDCKELFDTTPAVFFKCPVNCPTCPKHVQCPSGVKILRDPCGCCLNCVSPAGEDCDLFHICDAGLVCRNGTCRDIHPSGCRVGSKYYQDGDKWKPNCQTICECQNGIYGCSDVCQQDQNASECKYGRQFVMESACCSRWVCADSPTPCANITTDWTECSCLNPVSYQWSNTNPRCQWVVQQKLCPNLRCKEAQDGVQGVYPFPDHTERNVLAEAKRYCGSSLYQRYEYIGQDNCKSVDLHLQKTCASECHIANGTKLCCLPNEFSSLQVQLKCPNQKTVSRTIPVLAGCQCDVC